MLLKKLNIIKTSFLLLFICSIAFSCNNKKDKITTPLTVENIAGIYTITDAKMKNGNTEKDVYESFDDCQKHNTYGFNKNMVWYLGGVSQQNCTGPDESGTWTLNGNVLTINSQQSGTYAYNITAFDGKVLVGTIESNTGTLTTTFTKQ